MNLQIGNYGNNGRSIRPQNERRTLIKKDSEFESDMDSNVKKSLIDFIYGRIELPRYKLLDNHENLSSFQSRVEKIDNSPSANMYIAANYDGEHHLLVFVKIREEYCSYLIYRKSLKYKKNDLDVSNIKFKKVNSQLDIEIYDGTIIDGVLLDDSYGPNKNKNQKFVVEDLYMFKGQKMTDMDMKDKLEQFKRYLTNINKVDFNNNKLDNMSYEVNSMINLEHINIISNKIYDFKNTSQIKGLSFYPKYFGVKYIYLFPNSQNSNSSNPSNNKNKLMTGNGKRTLSILESRSSAINNIMKPSKYADPRFFDKGYGSTSTSESDTGYESENDTYVNKRAINDINLGNDENENDESENDESENDESENDESENDESEKDKSENDESENDESENEMIKNKKRKNNEGKKNSENNNGSEKVEREKGNNESDKGEIENKERVNNETSDKKLKVKCLMATLRMKKGNLPDIYKLNYAIKLDGVIKYEYLDDAHIPDEKCSKMWKNIFKTNDHPKLVKCKYLSDKEKWLPVNLEENKNRPTYDYEIMKSMEILNIKFKIKVQNQ